MEQATILSARPFDGSYLTPDFVARRLSGGPAAPTEQTVAGDWHLNPGAWPDVPLALTEASVLVPLIGRPEGLTVLLTRRTDDLAQHAGQVAFPGGRREPEDRDEVAAALRETLEEIGLPPSHVRVLGRLAAYTTRTGYRVTPVVGLVAPPFPLAADPREVAEIFEVPLEAIVDPANHQRHCREDGGQRRYFYVIPWRDKYIWGATAGMLVNLARSLAP